MQVVINISEEMYDDIKEGYYCSEYGDELVGKVKDGTQLPKGHGRLIDADAITKDLNTLQDAFRIYQQTGDKSSFSIVCVAETILEADKEG